MNLIIGLLIGIACAVMLVIMWRAVGRLREDDAGPSDVPRGELPPRGHAARHDPPVGG